MDGAFDRIIKKLEKKYWKKIYIYKQVSSISSTAVYSLSYVIQSFACFRIEAHIWTLKDSNAKKKNKYICNCQI